jgi:type IV secretion system pilin
MHLHLLLAAGCPQSSGPYSQYINANTIGIPCSTPNLGSAVANTVALVMSVLGGLALIFIIVGGLQYVLSAGNPKRATQARETILYAVIGLVVAIAGYAIVTFLAGATLGGYK